MARRPDRVALTPAPGILLELDRLARGDCSLLPRRPPPGYALVSAVAELADSGHHVKSATWIAGADPSALEPVRATSRVLYFTMPEADLLAWFPEIIPEGEDDDDTQGMPG